MFLLRRPKRKRKPKDEPRRYPIPVFDLNQPVQRKGTSPCLMTLALLGWLVLIFAGVVMLTLDEYKPESHVVETQATIIQKWESGISRGTAYHIRYRFTGGDLKTYEAETSVNRELYDVVLSGSKIAVAYVAENPKNSRIKSRKGELEDSSSGTVIVLIVIGLAVMGLILITSAKSLRDQMNRYSFPK